jgi:hypothetical protein
MHSQHITAAATVRLQARISNPSPTHKHPAPASSPSFSSRNLQLGLADAVPLPPGAASALDIAQAATACSSSSSSSNSCAATALRVHRLMRACATLGIFRMRASSSSSSELWEHTSASLLLRRNHPDSLRETVLFLGGVQYVLRLFKSLPNCRINRSLEIGTKQLHRFRGPSSTTYYHQHFHRPISATAVASA